MEREIEEGTWENRECVWLFNIFLISPINACFGTFGLSAVLEKVCKEPIFQFKEHFKF